MAAAPDISSQLTSNRTEPGKYESNYLGWLDRIETEGVFWRNLEDNDRWSDYSKYYRGPRYPDLRDRPKFRVEIIRPTIDRVNALLLENKPGAKIMPWRDGLQATAAALEKLFEAHWMGSGMQANLEDMRKLASIFGSAGIDLAWNPGMHFGRGDIDPVPLDPRQVIFDPIVRRARDMNKAQYLRIETVKNIWDLQYDYPGRGMLVRPDASISSVPNSVVGSGNQNVINAVSTSFFGRIQKLEEGPIPRKRCREYWIRDPNRKGNGDLVFPRGRLTERAGEVILDDKENIYWDGQWPVVWYDNQPDTDTAWGRSEVEALRYLSDAANRVGNLFVENTILGGNLVIVTDSDAITNETRNKLTNAAALVISKKFGRQLEYRPPQPMPPHMMGFVQQAQGFADYVVGLRDGMVEGRGRMELRSGVQLEGLQTAGQILVRAMARRLEEFMERLGQLWVSRILQFYRGERLMYFLDVGSTEYKQLEFSYQKFFDQFAQGMPSKKLDQREKINELMQSAWREFAFKILPLSTLASTKMARVGLLTQLAETGRYPFKRLFREIGIDDADDVMKEAAEERAKYGPPEQPKKGSKGKK